MEQDTDGVVLFRGGGWSDSILETNASFAVKSFDIERFRWRFFRFKTLRFGHAASLIVRQGLPIQKLFAPGVTLHWVSRQHDTQYDEGPFLYLKGTVPAVTSHPPRIEDAIFARVDTAPPDMPHEALLELLLRHLPA